MEALERAGELKRVKAELSPMLEMAEVADRAVKSGGPVLLFENVAGYKGARVLMNQFGSERRMKMALGVDSLDDVARRIEVLLHPAMPSEICGQAEDAADAGGSGIVFSEARRRQSARRAKRLCCAVRMSTC